MVIVDAPHEGFRARLEKLLTPEQLADPDRPPPGTMERVWAEVRAAGDLGDIPLMVLTRGRTDSWPPDWPREEVQTAWLDGQNALAGLSTRGKVVVCPGSGHHIQRDEPHLIVGAISRVIHALR